MVSGYDSSLRWVLQHSGFILAVLLITIATNIYLLIVIPKGFFPQQDTGILQGGILGAEDISYQAMQALTRRFVTLIKSDSAVETCHRLHRRLWRH